MSIDVVGVDGCKSGWICAEYSSKEARFRFTQRAEFTSLIRSYSDVALIAVDMPIGLTENGKPRQCDLAARKLVGPRRSSIFPAPDRRLLASPSYASASELSRELSGKGLTQQSFAIFNKIAEVDRALSPELQSRVFEVHPEVGFWAAAGRQLRYPKRKVDGFNERRSILEGIFPGVDIPTRIAAARLCNRVGPDDILDAMIAAWSAWRAAQSLSERIPPTPELDSRGLRMEMVY